MSSFEETKMKICIIGTGYVGLVTGACLADLGNQVICVDIDKTKINNLRKGKVPIYEPGLEEIVRRGQKHKNLHFITNISDGVKKSQIIFIAVGTPPRENGEADLSYVENVTKEIVQGMNSYKLIVEKSTVPVETGEKVKQTIVAYNKKKIEFDVASNPEFLREGSAISDFMHPDRIVLGVETKKAKDLLVKLYKPLRAPFVITDIKSAEIIKHASNSFLATKISFINAVSQICERVDADIIQVANGMGMDSRIGRFFLNAGIGFGGFCFPKDLAAFIKISDSLGYNFALLKSVEKINKEQIASFIKKIEEALWIIQNKTIGILGLSFKPNTDDLRYAPSLEIISALLKGGAKIKCFDPQAMPKAKKIFKNNIEFCSDSYKAAKGSDCLVIVTEWDEFKELNFKKLRKILRQPIIVDGRNMYNPNDMKKLGFKYISVGRKAIG